MKIAIITERADIRLGGAERSVFELADALSTLENKVDILAAKGKANNENTHILCKDLPGRRVCLFTFAKKLKKYLAENHYDIIHSVLPFVFADIYQPRGGSYPESILRNADSFVNPMVACYKKATCLLNFRRTVLLRAEKKLCKNPNGPVIAALSEYVAEQFRQHYKIEDRRIELVPNGVETDAPVNSDETEKLRKKIVSQLALTDNPVFFLFAANNFRLKGLACLLRAIQLLKSQKSSRKMYLIVAGSGKVDKYYRLAQKYAVEKRIVFLGQVPDIQNLLSITDVAVLPTFYDPSSRFILEALAAGIPVITTGFNGATDLFVNGRHGRVIDKPQNTIALAKALTFFTDKENIQKTAQAIADDNIKENLSISRVAKQLQSVYESILSRKGQQ